jgi:hypothetical protein
MSPTRRSEQDRDQGLTSRWVQSMAERTSRRSSRSRSPRTRSMSPPRRARTPRRRRDSLSLSPGRSETYSAQSFEQEYESVQQDREEEVPEAGPSFSGQAPLGRTPDPIQQYSPHFYSREEAVTTILDWSVKVTPLAPVAVVFSVTT